MRREEHAKRPGFVASMKKLDRKKNLSKNGLLEKKLRPLKVRELIFFGTENFPKKSIFFSIRKCMKNENFRKISISKIFIFIQFSMKIFEKSDLTFFHRLSNFERA